VGIPAFRPGSTSIEQLASERRIRTGPRPVILKPMKNPGGQLPSDLAWPVRNG
jgi:hypothetical protein